MQLTRPRFARNEWLREFPVRCERFLYMETRMRGGSVVAFARCPAANLRPFHVTSSLRLTRRLQQNHKRGKSMRFLRSLVPLLLLLGMLGLAQPAKAQIGVG